MRITHFLIAALVSAVCNLVTPAPADEPVQAPVDESEMGKGLALPNSELPPDTPHLPGELTLFADYAFADKNRVPLYVINATALPVVFESQGSDIYLKLERLRSDGCWERAQTHQSSWCGNSYGHVTLPAGQHLRLRGYMPTKGEKSRVRFSSYGNETLISNEGDGFILPADVQAAQADGRARSIPSCLGEFLDPEYWRASKTPTPVEQVTALRLLQTYEDNIYYKRHAEATAHDWETKENLSEQETQAAKATRDILAGKWPDTRNPAALRDRCVQALTHPREGNLNFGSPEQNPSLTWMVLASLAQTEFRQLAQGQWRVPADTDDWKPVANLIMEASDGGKIQTNYAAVNIAAITPFADHLLPDRFFEENLKHGRWSVRVCASALARRKRWATIVNLAWSLSPKDQLEVLDILSHPGTAMVSGPARNPEPGEEEKFWRYCLGTFPAEACAKLAMGEAGSDDPWKHQHFSRAMHDTLHDYFVRETERSTTAGSDYELGEDEGLLSYAVSLLASWDLEEDTPILQRLLTHRGYRTGRGSMVDADHLDRERPYTARFYIVRTAAKAVLEKRGVEVPADLVLRKEIAP